MPEVLAPDVFIGPVVRTNEPEQQFTQPGIVLITFKYRIVAAFMHHVGGYGHGVPQEGHPYEVNPDRLLQNTKESG